MEMNGAFLHMQERLSRYKYVFNSNVDDPKTGQQTALNYQAVTTTSRRHRK